MTALDVLELLNLKAYLASAKAQPAFASGPAI
jgi:hypothetical protein